MDTIDQNPIQTCLPHYSSPLSPLHRHLHSGIPRRPTSRAGASDYSPGACAGTEPPLVENPLAVLVVSAPLTCLIFTFIQPTYEASSLLRIEPAQPELFSPLKRSM